MFEKKAFGRPSKKPPIEELDQLNQKMSNQEMADFYGVTKGTIERWKREYRKELALNEQSGAILEQEVSLDELEATAGGRDGHLIQFDDDRNNCMRTYSRQIYGGSGFANCAAVVEDDSWCDTNDACYHESVKYEGMNDCARAWR